MRSKVTAPLLALLGVALLGGSVALAHGAFSFTGFSGYEVSAGGPCSIGGQSATCGTSFGGWTDPVNGVGWESPPGDGGKWAASVSYTGTPGPGLTVNIVGGVWEWRQPNGTLHRGRVLDGAVVWPTAGGATDVVRMSRPSQPTFPWAQSRPLLAVSTGV